MERVLSELSENEIMEKVRAFSAEEGIEHLHVEIVAAALCSTPSLANSVSRNELPAEDRLRLWVKKCRAGYGKRISARVSKMPGTLPDLGVNVIIQAAMPHISAADAELIVYAHRLAMSAENIMGLLLEEYIYSKLQELEREERGRARKWALAWGETVRGVDFCSSEGDLLQIKNRSNSENSSSARIREGTNIKKWYRVNAANGETEWQKLCGLLECRPDFLTEEDFHSFIRRTLCENPRALAIELENPWSNNNSQTN